MTGKKTQPEELSKKEVEMLVKLYMNPDANYNTYGLAQSLHPDEEPQSQEFAKAYGEARTTSERLIMLDLVDGERHKDAGGGIFFADLRLTKKGVRKAIEVK
jgi:hypothetical protein